MTQLLSSIIATALGSVLLVNGVLIHSDDVIKQAKMSVNGANVHQLATVIELYYSDHNQYPNVSGGEELVNTLERDGYIMNHPIDSKVFDYQPKNNAQDYKLSLNQ